MKKASFIRGNQVAPEPTAPTADGNGKDTRAAVKIQAAHRGKSARKKTKHVHIKKTGARAPRAAYM
jgi:hypothetical protein